MIGAIVGDIVGSVYEWNNIKTKDFELFRKDCFFTDDTVMTCAVAQAIMQGGEKDDFIDAMKRYGRMYPDAGYGGNFGAWLFSDDREPYGSFGNGSAMRVSPCAWIMDCGFYARTGVWPVNGRKKVLLSARVTHDHPEGIKGAAAVAAAIFLCRYYFGGWCGEYEQPIRDDLEECKRRIREYIEREYGYDLSPTLEEIRPGYRFNETCQQTVPQAIIAFLESRDFEDAIRNAISLGGDSDTLAAITGSIAEAAYGVPAWIEEKALSYLDAPLLDVVYRWKAYLASLGVRPAGEAPGV
jgi:ADP-ribosylglycohydrolase